MANLAQYLVAHVYKADAAWVEEGLLLLPNAADRARQPDAWRLLQASQTCRCSFRHDARVPVQKMSGHQLRHRA